MRRWSVEEVIWYLPMKLISALDMKFIRTCTPCHILTQCFVHALIMANNNCSLKEHLSGWSSQLAYNSSCKCIVFLPLVYGVVMSEYLNHGKSQLFLCGRILEQALLWDISASLIPACIHCSVFVKASLTSNNNCFEKETLAVLYVWEPALQVSMQRFANSFPMSCFQ